MLPKKNSIIILSLIMILINFYFINNHDLDYVRPLRSISSFAFFTLFAVFGGLKKINLTIAFLFLCLSDLLIINYDYKLFNNLTSIAKSISYIFIGWHLVPKFKIELENKNILFVYLILIAFSAFMFYELVDTMTLTIHEEVHKYLYLFYAFVLLVMLVLVGNYNFRYHSIQSTSCMYFAFLFAISDLFGFITYYLDIYLFHYPTRLFYILGLAILTAYAVLPFQEEELYEDDSMD